MSNYSAPNGGVKFSNRLRRRRNETLVAEFISTESVHFQFIRDHIILKSLECTHSATKTDFMPGFGAFGA